jgi:hypothetical protein
MQIYIIGIPPIYKNQDPMDRSLRIAHKLSQETQQPRFQSTTNRVCIKLSPLAKPSRPPLKPPLRTQEKVDLEHTSTQTMIATTLTMEHRRSRRSPRRFESKPSRPPLNPPPRTREKVDLDHTSTQMMIATPLTME